MWQKEPVLRDPLERSGHMRVKWSEEDAKHPRFSEYGVSTHLKLIKSLQMKFFREDQEKVKERMPKYKSYGNVIKPS
jgi:hypothetical protein